MKPRSGQQIRRACWAAAGLWWLVALQLAALGLFPMHPIDELQFITSGTLMWLFAGALAPWVWP